MSATQPDSVSTPSGTGGVSRGPRLAFLRGTVVVAAAMGLVQVAGYLLSVLGPRVLTQDEFGALGSLMNLIVIGAVLPFGVQAVAARLVVGSSDDSELGVGARMVRFSVSAGLMLGLVALALAPLLTSLLRQPTVWNAAFVALMFPALTISTCQYGLAQGHEDHLRLAGLLALHGFFRYGLAIGALLVTQSVLGTIMAMCVGAWLGALLGMPVVGRFLDNRRPEDVGQLRSQVIHATHALLALYLATNVDLLLARYYLTGDESGAYAVGTIVSRIAFWLPSFVAVVTFARMADDRRYQTTLKAASAVASIGVMLVLVLLVVPQLVIAAIAGAQYQFMAPYLWLFGVIGGAFSVAQFVLYSRIAIDDRRAVLALWTSVALIVVGVSAWHGSVAVVAAVTAVVALSLAVAGLVVLAIDRRRGIHDPVEGIEALEAA